MPQNDNLLPCPFCGGDASLDKDFNDHDIVICEECYSCGPAAISEKSAIILWNTRIRVEKDV